MEDKLKPCPFCGSEPITKFDELCRDFTVQCPCCYGIVLITGGSKEEAIRRWNTRYSWATGLPDKQKVVDFLEELLDSCRARSINADEEYSLVEELLKTLK